MCARFSPLKAPQGGSTVLKKIFPKALIRKTMVLVNSQSPFRHAHTHTHAHIPLHLNTILAAPLPSPPYLTPQVWQKKKKKTENTKTKQKRFWQKEKRAFHWQAWVRALFTYRSTAPSPSQHRAPPLDTETWPSVSFWITHEHISIHINQPRSKVAHGLR